MTRLVQLLLMAFGVSHAAATQPSVERVMLPDSGGHLVYVVNERAPSLSAVARELYSDRRMADEIARWNGLPRESWLKIGDRLKIVRAPTNSAQQGTALLIRYWQIAGKYELVARLKGLGADHRRVAKDWPLKGIPPILGARLPGYPLKRTDPVVHQPASVAAGSPPSPGRATETTTRTGTATTGHATTNVTVVEQRILKRRRPSSNDDDSEESKREPKSDSYWLGKDAAELIETITRKIGLSNGM